VVARPAVVANGGGTGGVWLEGLGKILGISFFGWDVEKWNHTVTKSRNIGGNSK